MCPLRLCDSSLLSRDCNYSSGVVLNFWSNAGKGALKVGQPWKVNPARMELQRTLTNESESEYKNWSESESDNYGK